MMREQMREELTAIEKRKEQKAEYQSSPTDRLIGCKRVLVTDLERDVYDTSRFKALKQRCVTKIKSGELAIDKTKVQKVVLSLIKANRQILRANKISENIDDFIYLTVMLKQSLVECAETEQPPRPTPVQIRLPTPLVYRDALLICNQGKREN